MEVENKIWKTCCALHNMLLEVDDLGVKWSGGIGMHDEGDVEITSIYLLRTIYN